MENSECMNLEESDCGEEDRSDCKKPFSFTVAPFNIEQHLEFIDFSKG